MKKPTYLGVVIILFTAMWLSFAGIDNPGGGDVFTDQHNIFVNTNTFKGPTVIIISTNAGPGSSYITTNEFRTAWWLGSGFIWQTGANHEWRDAGVNPWFQLTNAAAALNGNGIKFQAVTGGGGASPHFNTFSPQGDANIGIGVYGQGTGGLDTTNLFVHGLGTFNDNLIFGNASSDAITLNSGTTAIPNGHTFGSNLLVLSNFNNRIGILTNIPATALHVGGAGNIRLDNGQNLQFGGSNTAVDGTSSGEDNVAIITGGIRNFRVWETGVWINQTNNSPPGASFRVTGSTILGTNGTIFLNMSSTNILINAPSIAATAQFITNINLTGAIVGAAVNVTPQFSAMGGIVYDGTVVSSGVIGVRFNNYTASPIDPTNQLHRVSIVNYLP